MNVIISLPGLASRAFSQISSTTVPGRMAIMGLLRHHPDLPIVVLTGCAMEYTSITDQNRPQITSLLEKLWFSTTMVIRGKQIDMTRLDGLIAKDAEEIVGLLTFTIEDDTCEIISLNSLMEGRGIATSLVERLRAIAEEKKCRKILVVTTNDNTDAIRFYQKRGFDMATLHHDALEVSRKLKPEIPLLGQNDIPIRHEIEFELLQ
jgi:N-acetylglutamate synthase-like GNAT family acetyltransferase